MGRADGTAEDTGLPVPKYRIGDRVFWANTVSESEKLPCPDCLGSGLWEVRTPAGASLQCQCARCTGYALRDLPSLTRQTIKPYVKSLTVGSIQIDTNRGYGDAVRYMCRETGIGSGSVYDESTLFSDEDAAQATASALADQATAGLASAERTEQARLSSVTLKDATLEACRDAVWSSWYRYRNLRENIEGLLETAISLDDLKEEIESEFRFDKQYRKDDHPFDAVLIAAAGARASSPDLAKALDALPFLSKPANDDLANPPADVEGTLAQMTRAYAEDVAVRS